MTNTPNFNFTDDYRTPEVVPEIGKPDIYDHLLYYGYKVFQLSGIPLLVCILNSNNPYLEEQESIAEQVSSVLSEYSDPDQDGLTTETEIMIGTNPHKADSDNDGINDSITYTDFPVAP
jgi:hypothetical protein